MNALWPSVRKEVPSLIFERSWNTVSYLPEYISYLRILKHKALAFSDCAKIWISNFSSFPEDFQLRSTSEIFFFSLNPQERPGWINASFQVLENLGSLSLSSIEFVPQSIISDGNDVGLFDLLKVKHCITSILLVSLELQQSVFLC